MKDRRLFVYGASSVMMLLVLTLLMRVSIGDLPVTSASAQGIVLSAAELAPTERRPPWVHDQWSCTWSLANLVSSSGLSNGVGESKGALPVSEHLRVFGKLPSQCIN